MNARRLSFFVLSLTAGLAAHRAPAQEAAPAGADSITVRVDRGVELLGVVFRLAGNREYGKCMVPRYAEAVDAWFGPRREHPAIQRAAQLRQQNGVAFDAVMGLAVHLDGTAALAPRVPLTPRPPSLDARWADEAVAFVGLLREFAADAEFEEFFAKHEALYATAVRKMRAHVDENIQHDWFDAFFGARPTAAFTVTVAMLNGGHGYGPRVAHADGREDLHCVIGVWDLDKDGAPAFRRNVVETVVHEFCHSYCNHLVDAHLAALEAAGARIYAPVAAAMRQQAYTTPRVMLQESLVRASVIRYVTATGGPAKGRAEIGNQLRASFFWAGELAEELAAYEADREKYPTLAAFMPRVVEFFVAYAAKHGVDPAGQRPRLVSISPADGAADVDPATSEIVVTFDRPMQDNSWSFVGGGPSFPEVTGQPRFDAARKVLRLPVRLLPDHAYGFGLNSAQHQGFKSADGAALEPVQVRFRTRSKSG